MKVKSADWQPLPEVYRKAREAEKQRDLDLFRHWHFPPHGRRDLWAAVSDMGQREQQSAHCDRQ
ncbi:hypothetical protein [Mesorhizobium sp. M0496]|uniref:hypothetical protein n=1 Tax=Mesorhizobium sp. M0496 TaxID=2956952 RepID=UPI0033353F5A